MQEHQSMWGPCGVLFLSFLLALSPSIASGQSSSQQGWQETSFSSAQSHTQHNASQSTPVSEQKSSPTLHYQDTSSGRPQTFMPGAQGMHEPQGQREIPAVWQPQTHGVQPPAQPPEHIPGYLGVSSRDFHRSRLCMHALSVHGVEITGVDANSPAERAGLRTAHRLSARESLVATVAGFLTLSPAASLAPAAVEAGGGVGHGDIVLAVGGTRVKTKAAFEQQLARFGPQSIVYLTIRRGEAVLQIPVQLGEQPAAQRQAFSEFGEHEETTTLN